MTENNDWTLNFYYTDKIKFGTRQDEGKSQEATETFFDKPKSQAQQRKQLVKKRAEREREREEIAQTYTSLVLNSVYIYMYVKVISIAKISVDTALENNLSLGK